MFRNDSKEFRNNSIENYKRRLKFGILNIDQSYSLDKL